MPCDWSQIGMEATGIAKRHWPLKTFPDTFAGALASGEQIIEFSKLTLGLLADQLKAHGNLNISRNPSYSRIELAYIYRI